MAAYNLYRGNGSRAERIEEHRDAKVQLCDLCCIFALFCMAKRQLCPKLFAKSFSGVTEFSVFCAPCYYSISFAVMDNYPPGL